MKFDISMVVIRPMENSDLQAVVEIESAEFSSPWPRSDIAIALHNWPRSCFVAVFGEAIAGYLICQPFDNHFEILRLAVGTAWQRRGIGRKLIEKIKVCSWSRGKPHVQCPVWEGNLDAQLFFRSLGFRCVRTLQDFYVDGADAYLFTLTCRSNASMYMSVRGAK
jgi:[ribosomal protein S18]-alanine N-acetyltransferase